MNWTLTLAINYSWMGFSNSRAHSALEIRDNGHALRAEIDRFVLGQQCSPGGTSGAVKGVWIFLANRCGRW